MGSHSSSLHPLLSVSALNSFLIPSKFNLALLLLLTAGLLLWGINLLYGRPLFLDEANVVRNLYERSYAGLFRPLSYEQYAAPLYLMVTKFLAEQLGYWETVVRVPAFAGGLMAIVGLYHAGKSMHLEYWGLLPLALLFVNPTVLQYVGEVKPYGLDLGIAACLLAMYASKRYRLWQWAVVGCIAPWFSLPSVFVLASVGITGLFDNRRWGWPIAGWLISFTVLYTSVLQGSVGSDYLDTFHASYFFPLPDSIADLRAIGEIVRRMIRLHFGFTLIALIWGGALICTGLAYWRVRYAYLVLPLLFSVGASVFHFYSLIDRLMLFALPGVWLAAALAARKGYRALGNRGGIAFLFVSLLALGGTNIYRYFLSPLRFSDGRALAELALTHPYRADGLARPVLDYYLRIRPGARAAAPAAKTVKEYYHLYDVAMAKPVRQTMTKDSLRAVDRGCRVRKIELYRAAALRIECP